MITWEFHEANFSNWLVARIISYGIRKSSSTTDQDINLIENKLISSKRALLIDDLTELKSYNEKENFFCKYDIEDQIKLNTQGYKKVKCHITNEKYLDILILIE